MLESLYPEYAVPVIESAHVFDECDSVAKNIALQIKEMLYNLSSYQTQQFADSMEFTYSGYSINTNYLSDLDKKPYDTQMFYESEKSDAEAPLYYVLYYDEHDSEQAACNTRQIRHRNNDSVSVTYEDDEAQIEINIAKFIDINDRINYISLMSTIAHELQHIFVQYVHPDYDFSNTNKDNPFYEFKNTNIFNISEYNDLMIVEPVLYVISHNEQRGFLSQLRTFLIGASQDESAKQRLFTNTVRYASHKGFPLLKNRIEFNEQLLINHIYRNRIVGQISRSIEIEGVSDAIEKLKKSNKDRYDCLMLIIGYYMFRHNMLKLRRFDILNNTAKEVFSDENIFSIINLPEHKLNKSVHYKLIDCISYSIFHEFDLYKNKIHDEIERHLHNIFDYKKLQTESYYYSDAEKQVRRNELIILYD